MNKTTEYIYHLMDQPTNVNNIETTNETNIETSIETSIETIIETSIETIIETSIETIIETSIETSIETGTEPIIKTSTEPIIEPIVKSIIEPTMKQTIEPTMKPIIQSTIEPIVKPIVEPIIQSTIEPIVKPIKKTKKSSTKYVHNSTLIGAHRRFNDVMYNKYDTPARNIIKKQLGDFVKDNPDIYGQDLIITSPTCKYKYLYICFLVSSMSLSVAVTAFLPLYHLLHNHVVSSTHLCH